MYQAVKTIHAHCTLCWSVGHIMNSRIRIHKQNANETRKHIKIVSGAHHPNAIIVGSMHPNSRPIGDRVCFYLYARNPMWTRKHNALWWKWHSRFTDTLKHTKLANACSAHYRNSIHSPLHGARRVLTSHRPKCADRQAQMHNKDFIFTHSNHHLPFVRRSSVDHSRP